jgi:hypothetical protein
MHSSARTCPGTNVQLSSLLDCNKFSLSLTEFCTTNKKTNLQKAEGQTDRYTHSDIPASCRLRAEAAEMLFCSYFSVVHYYAAAFNMRRGSTPAYTSLTLQ